jgi:hypothetical protein
MLRYFLPIVVTALVATAPAAAVIVTSTAGAPDPGIAAGETLLVSFDTANVAGVTDTRSGNVITTAGSVGGVRAAPAGTLSGGVYRSIGTGGASLFDFSAWTAGRGLASVSFYWGSIDAYNFVDILDGAGAVVSTIGGGALPLANGNQQLATSNRRVFFTFAPTENAMALRLRSTGNAFEFDSIAAQAIPGAVPEPATWAMLIAGFGMVGFALRRKRTGAVSA